MTRRDDTGGARAGTLERLRRGVPVLEPLAWLYAGGVAVVRRRRGQARLDPSSRPRVIAVGNLEIGGSGKTPLAMLLLETLERRGNRVGYASRGYGGRAEHGPWVTLVAPDAGAIDPAAGVRVVSRDAPDLPREIGDEGAMVAGRSPGATLALSRDKRSAVAALAEAGVDTVVVDDAFQSWRLARHLDIVLLDAERPLGSGRVLPAGTLREPPSALRRADVVVFNGAGDAAAVQAARARVAPWLQNGTAVAGLARGVRLVSPGEDADAPPRRAVLISGIARPERFAGDVARLGVDVAAHLVFPDHHRYGDADLARVRDACRSADCDAVITTEKDWVKLRRFGAESLRPWIARLDVAWVGEPPAL